ncbi:MAG: 16S rRNA (uracil(1498)-N(3))-methyltransferase [Alphaproteobacteria bacterium]|nr:16S rRNA (uracil(1498)-N(3))-methyltransferase [Alphaproteobacteria bacterium]
MRERSAARLFVPGALAAGDTVELDPGQAHRLRNVLRLAPGAAIAVFNETAGEFICRVEELARHRGRLAVERVLRAPAPEPDLWLLFAPIKRTRLDWLVEKATELGAAALVPVWTARTQPERLNRERLNMVAIAAAEQSERLSLPEIRNPEALEALMTRWPAARPLLVCDESGGGRPIGEAVAELAAAAAAALLVGPEGGFAETELDALGKLSFVTRIGLGPRVLRAETAALAALAAYQAVAGDWRHSRGR